MAESTTINPHTASADNVSLTGRPWLFPDACERQTRALMQKHELPEILARILVARGVALEAVEDFLSPSLRQALPDPSHLLDMDVAAQRVAAAVISGEQIAIFGDYDVDGATSSALLLRFMRALGAEPLVHIPDRMKEGYGPNAAAMLALQARGVSLVITVDCGTLAHAPLATAHEAGLDVLVIDHHMGEAQLPACFAVVNPNRMDENSPHGHMAAVGVAFLLVIAVNRHLRQTGWFATRKEPDPRQWLDIVALGTVCDVVALHGVNRALVAQGLKVMAGRGNPGISALLDLCGIEEKPIAYHAAFVIGPRINAGGRVGESALGVQLLATDDPGEARALAHRLNDYNSERKAIEAMVQEDAHILAQACDPDCPVLVVAGTGWHPGVIGIVAGRLKERFHKPVAVISLEGGMGKASARSVEGMDIGAAVIAAREQGLLVAGGGHAMAAGFSVEEQQLSALTAFFHARFHAHTPTLKARRKLMIDGAVSISGANCELASMLGRMEPFGQGNRQIRLAIHNVVNSRPEPVGDLHVRTALICRMSNTRLSAIAFRCLDTQLGDALFSTAGKTVHIAGQLRLQEWMGKQKVSLQIDDIALGE